MACRSGTDGRDRTNTTSHMRRSSGGGLSGASARSAHWPAQRGAVSLSPFLRDGTATNGHARQTQAPSHCNVYRYGFVKSNARPEVGVKSSDGKRRPRSDSRLTVRALARGRVAEVDERSEPRVDMRLKRSGWACESRRHVGDVEHELRCGGSAGGGRRVDNGRSDSKCRDVAAGAHALSTTRLGDVRQHFQSACSQVRLQLRRFFRKLQQRTDDADDLAERRRRRGR